MTDELDIARQHAGLRRVALRLVRDEASADDLVQETWLAALEHPPSHFDGFKSWLKTVLVHKAARQARRRVRQRERELLAARLETDFSRDACEADSLRGALESALTELGEPYASALRARYFDDLSYEDAARLLGRPADTLRTHVRRGLAALRARLARRFEGDRRAMGIALVGAFDWRPEEVHTALAAQGSTSTLGLAAAWKVLATVLVVGAVGLAVWRQSGSESGPELALAAPAPLEAAPAPQLDSPPRAAAAGSTRGERDPIERAAVEALPASASAVTQASALASTAILVVAPDGRAVPDALVHREDALGVRPLRRTAADGLLHVQVDEERLVTSPIVEGRFLVLWATADGHASSPRTMIEWPPAAETEALRLGLGGPELVLRGRVVDALGEPIAGARIASLNNSTQPPRSRPRSLTDAPHLATSDASGGFELRHLAQEAQTLLAFAGGYAEQVVAIDGRDLALLERTITLALGGAVRGVVRNESGEPLPGAVVSLRWFTAQSPPRAVRAVADEAGRYRLRDLTEGRCDLVASVRGASADAVVVVTAGETTEIDLVLRPVHALRAQLVDEDGKPYTRARFAFVSLATLRESDVIQGWSVTVVPDEHGFISLERDPDEPIYGGAVAEHTGQSFPAGWTRWDEPDPEVRRIVCRVEPEAWGSIGGVLLDHRERPQAGVLLRTTDLASQATIGTEVRPDGSFLVENVPPGEYRLAIIERGLGAWVFRDVTVSAGEPVDVGALRLPEPAELSIEWGFPPEADYTVVVAQEVVGPGALTPFTPIHMGRPEDLASVQALPGRYSVLVLSGERLVQLRALALRPHRRHVVPLGPDAPLLACFDARSPSGSTEATFAVYDAGALDLALGLLDAAARRRVAAELTPTAVHVAELGPDGWFRCEQPLQPGRWAVLVETPDGPAAGFLTLALDETVRLHVWLELE